MASAKLYLDTRSRRKDGTFPLKISVVHNSPFQINLKIYLTEEQFEGDKIINHPLKEVYNNIVKQRFLNVTLLLLKLETNGELRRLSSKDLKKLIEDEHEGVDDSVNDDDSSYKFKDHIERYIEDKANARTKDLYRYTLNKVSEYTDINKLTFEDITYAWLKSFDRFMSNSCSTNSRAIHLRNIRSVFNDAIDEDKVSLNLYPFRRFKIKTEATIKRSLTVEELVMLRDYECEEYLVKYRDIFMLIFYLIGINIIDLLHLKEIKNGKITYKRAKTGRLYTIEVLPEAQAIFDKYKGKDYLLDVLDTYSKYKDFTHRLNKNLKRIGPVEIGKQNKKTIKPLFPTLSTYYARHSWATIAASLDIPKETIAAALGHGGNSVTDIYINFDQKKIDEANRKVIEYLNKTAAEV